MAWTIRAFIQDSWVIANWRSRSFATWESSTSKAPRASSKFNDGRPAIRDFSFLGVSQPLCCCD